MAGSVSRFALLVSKFRGCLVGALVGDCLGSARVLATNLHILDSANKEVRIAPSSRIQGLCSVAEGLLVGGNNEPPSGNTSRENDLSSNTAAAVTPIALFHYGDIKSVVKMGKETGLYRTKNDDVISEAAILHAVSVHQALKLDPIISLDTHKFVSQLSEVVNDRRGAKPGNYLHNLGIIDELLHGEIAPADATMILEKESPQDCTVLSAIFTFLYVEKATAKSRKSVDNGKDWSPVMQVLREIRNITEPDGSKDYGALATLTCALTGAHHGIEAVPESLRNRCQTLNETVKLADRLAFLFENQPGVFENMKITFAQQRL